MARARRIDANQREVVAAYRSAGMSVAVTSAAGDGFPDLVVGAFGRNFLVEVKDAGKSPSRRALTARQRQFHAEWKGSVIVIESADDAIGHIRDIRLEVAQR